MKLTFSYTQLLVVALIVFGLFFFSLRKKTTDTKTSINKNKSEKNVREIEITAKQFEFIPNLIKVKLGENIRLKITSADVTHGFSLPQFGINEVLPPNKTITVEFKANKRGSFSFFCSIPCGSGHSTMRGTFIVE